MHIILGAPGSGKSTTIPLVAKLLPEWIVLDWDALMTCQSACWRRYS